jgi:hypothetical protein
MKLALIGAAAVAAAAFVTPAFAAPPVVEDPGWCAQFYPNANCQNYGRGNPYTGSGYRHNWRNGNAMMLRHAWHRGRHHHRW